MAGGSSPRVWGTGFATSHLHCGGRFIPTCVGNGCQAFRQLLLVSVHPHVCGERRREMMICWPASGSSPRVWGTGTGAGKSLFMCRFIPTCVGNGYRSRKVFIHVPVHPHVCGERSAKWIGDRLAYGSSPRVWGTGVRPWYRRPLHRFIPTCVGNGLTITPSIRAVTVHPHVCGERAEVAMRFCAQVGSSPRVWGTDPRTKRCCWSRRFIPTCVGNGRW